VALAAGGNSCVGYTPPGVTRQVADPPRGTPPKLPATGSSSHDGDADAENQKELVEALRQRLLAQEATIADLARANSAVFADVAALRGTDSQEDVRHVAETRVKVASGKPRRRNSERGEPSRGTSADSKAERRRRARELRRKLQELEAQARALRAAAAAETPDSSTSLSDDSSPSYDDSPLPSGGSSPTTSADPSDDDEATESERRVALPGPYKADPKVKVRLEKADRIKVIRAANSRFKSLLDYRTYFLIRRDLTYSLEQVERAHKMNRRLDGAFQGQEPSNGAVPLNIFTFLTTFRRECDSAGLTHGQALPLLAFRLAGNAKRAFSSALNTRAGHKRYALATYGDAINWLLRKYATHAAMAKAYQDIITMKQADRETPTAFGVRVEEACDKLDGLFKAEDVKDVFINGLLAVVQPQVRVLDAEFPHRTFADTVSAAQMYWDGANELRASLKAARQATVKVGYAAEDPRWVERPSPPSGAPFYGRTPMRTPPGSPRPSVGAPTGQSPRSAVCYNCHRVGHFSKEYPEPPRPREPTAGAPTGQPSRTAVCYNCNKVGHVSRECLAPYRPRERPLTVGVHALIEGPEPPVVDDLTGSKNE